MLNSLRATGIAIALLSFSQVAWAFSEEDALQALDGRWQGTAIALTVDSESGTAILLRAGQRTEGPIEIIETIGQAARLTINGEPFVAHVLSHRLTFVADGEELGTALWPVE